jgi:hypothetical protein
MSGHSYQPMGISYRETEVFAPMVDIIDTSCTLSV